MINKYFDKNKAGFCHAEPMLYGLLKEHSKFMRNNPTEAEKLLWQYLNQNQLGYPFRRQHVIYDYIVDFICLPMKLVIEVDGGYHDELRQQYHDMLRTEYLKEQGFQVIRFRNEEIFTHIEKVLEQIKKYLI